MHKYIYIYNIKFIPSCFPVISITGVSWHQVDGTMVGVGVSTKWMLMNMTTSLHGWLKFCLLGISDPDEDLLSDIVIYACKNTHIL